MSSGIRLPTRRERLVHEMELCAIDAQALAHRMGKLEDLRLTEREHVVKVADAALTICLAAVALNGSATQAQREFFDDDSLHWPEGTPATS